MVTLIALIGQAFAFAGMSCEMMSHGAQQELHSLKHGSAGHSSMSHGSMSHGSMSHGSMSQGEIKHSGMEHSAMQHTDMDHSKSAASHIAFNGATDSENCCGAECTCPDNACSSTSAVASHAHSTAYMTNLAIRIVASQQHALHLSTSLYRPPIFA